MLRGWDWLRFCMSLWRRRMPFTGLGSRWSRIGERYPSAVRAAAIRSSGTARPAISRMRASISAARDKRRRSPTGTSTSRSLVAAPDDAHLDAVGRAAMGDHLVDQAAQQRLAALIAERRILPQSRQPTAGLQEGGTQVRADRVGPAALGLTPGEAVLSIRAGRATPLPNGVPTRPRPAGWRDRRC